MQDRPAHRAPVPDAAPRAVRALLPVGNVFVRAIGHPPVMRALTEYGLPQEWLMRVRAAADGQPHGRADGRRPRPHHVRARADRAGVVGGRSGSGERAVRVPARRDPRRARARCSPCCRSRCPRCSGRNRPTPAKLAPYECGIEPERLPKGERFSVKFYVVAMLFIIFDVEAIFLFPWAVGFRALGLFGLVEMASSSAWCSSPTCTCGSRAAWSGDTAERPPLGRDARPTRRTRGGARSCRLNASRASRPVATAEEDEEELKRGLLLTTLEQGRRLGAQAVDVAGHVRTRVLRDRDDGHGRRRLRPRRGGGWSCSARRPGRPT